MARGLVTEGRSRYDEPTVLRLGESLVVWTRYPPTFRTIPYVHLGMLAASDEF